MTPSGPEQLAARFRADNPHLHSVPPAQNQEGAYGGICNIQRVVQAGGVLTQLLAQPSYIPFEQLYRKLPESGMFDAAPDRNFKFELGAFTVPDNMALLLIDYRFDIYRLSGAAAGDTVPIEARRLSTQLGYKWNVSGRQLANIRMEVVPVPITATAEAYAGTLGFSTIQQDGPPIPVATPAQFNLAQFARSSIPAGGGLSLLPQRTDHLGPLALPFTQVITENQAAQFEVIVFQPIPIPIAFFELDLTGLLVPQNTIMDILEAQRACNSPGGGK
jgi:hypothetical protein